MPSRPQVPDILADVLGSPESVIRSSLRYDYSQIDDASRSQVQTAAVAIVRSGRKAQESLIDIGQRLAAVKELLPHGQFSEWCQVEFDMSQRTAQRMMAVADAFGGKSDTVSLLSDSALYLLAGPSVPEEARQEVIAEAQATGQSPTKAQVQAVIDQHKPAPPSYASVWEIQSQVGSVINTRWPDGKHSATWISAMRAAARTTGSALMHDVEEALEQAGIEYRKRDLVQAVNNVADGLEQELKRRQAAPSPQPAPATTLDIPIKRAAPAAEPAPVRIVTDPELFKQADAVLSAKELGSGTIRGMFLYDGAIWTCVGGSYAGSASGKASYVDCVRLHLPSDPIAPGQRTDHYLPTAYLPGRPVRHRGAQYVLGSQWMIVYDRPAVAAPDEAAATVTPGDEGPSKLLIDWTDDDWARWKAGQAPAQALTAAPADAAGITATDGDSSGGIAANSDVVEGDTEAFAFLRARQALAAAAANLQAAQKHLIGWHDELANMIDEIAAHVRRAMRELD